MTDNATTGKWSQPDGQLVVMMPLFNDWDGVSPLLAHLDRVFARLGVHPTVLLIDDGSDNPAPLTIGAQSYAALERIDVLVLRRNVGHQRAIALALAYVHEHMTPGAVLVMDGDGEDDPDDVPVLLQTLREGGARRVIFAERRKRSESLLFRVFYALYRSIHRLLTGIPVRVGNFSVIPATQLDRLVVVSELWNHYAAAVFKARIPRDSVPTVRARRLSGKSTMNFIALVGHGLSALSVHAEVIGVRLLAVVGAAATVILSLLGLVAGVRLFTSLAIPGWATVATGMLLLLLSQTLAFAVAFAFTVLHARSQPLFIPIRDYGYFVRKRDTLFPCAIASTDGPVPTHD